MNKTVLIVGGIAIVGVVIFLAVKNQQTQAAYLNQPGLVSAPQSGRIGGIGAYLNDANVNAISDLASSFAPGATGTNDPGLEDDSYSED